MILKEFVIKTKKKKKEGGDICIQIAESLPHTAETSNIVEQLRTPPVK